MYKLYKKGQIFFYVLIRSWNSYEYFDRCVDSILNQTYKNFKILFVDDSSNYTKKQKEYIRKKLKNHTVVFNKKRKFSVFNAYKMLRKYAENNDAIVLNLDGDDWLLGRMVLEYLAKVYSENPECLLSFGECVFWDGKKNSTPSRFVKEYTNIPYPKKVIRQNSFRKYPFSPLHPRTWKVWLFKKIRKQDLLRPDGTWLEFAEDLAMFLPMLEMAAERYKVIKIPLYVYNISSKHSDVKDNLLGLLKDELIIRKKKPYAKIR